MSRLPKNLFVAVLLLAGLPAMAATSWQHPLYLDGGGWWQGRIRIVVENDRDTSAEGEPVAVGIGTADGEAALVGQAVQALRVVNSDGDEVLWTLAGPDGNPLADGPIPAGSSLVIPAECSAHGTATYDVYFDNPAAGQVPDMLVARLGLVNGDVEDGAGDEPRGWKHDEPDAQHQAFWTTEHPQSGKRCLKTVVADGAEPTWIATRQQGIPIVGGAKYAMRAWVKAENVKGYAGWYIHVGNAKKPMMIAPMLTAGKGTFDWKQVTAEFTAPADANLADLGTVLRGTGTAWFDNVTLECQQAGTLRARALAPERLALKELGADAAWPAPDRANGLTWDHRVLVRVFNFSDKPLPRPLAFLDAGMLDSRLHGQLNRHAVVALHEGKRVKHFLDNNLMLFEASVPAKSVANYYVYFTNDSQIQLPAVSHFDSVLASSHNLAKNPSFEQVSDRDGSRPEGWTISGGGRDGVSFGLDAQGRSELGKRCAKMQVSHEAPKHWRGWLQKIAVQPGRTYLLAAWVKCEDLHGNVRLHAHCHNAEGKLCKTNGMISVGPDLHGTTDWTLLSGRVVMPADAATLQVHLTMDATGTVWHDGLLVAECLPGIVARLEGRPLQDTDPVRVWPVEAVVKVFPDELAPRAARPARIACARNEKEPLQLAIRSPRDLQDVRIEVDPITGPGGARLSEVEVNVVGYVPIDHPTSYYQSQTPAWHRKIPLQPGACDGWAGPWPDPLLPRSALDLKANETQAVWVTVGVGKEAAPGDYVGKVRLVHQGTTVAETPLTVHVWNFTLPDENHVKAIYDARIGRSDAWQQSTEELYPEIVRFMASRRLCPDRIRVAPKFDYKDGQVTADFTEFDKMARWYFDELKLPHSYTPWHLYLFGWGFAPRPMFGEHPYPGEPPYDGADRSQLRPEYKKVYQAALKTFWDHVKANGWEKKFILYISDEPFYTKEPIRKQMRALCDMIHEVSPEIPTYSSTWHHVPDWDGYLDVWGIGHYGIVMPEKIAELKAAGARVWFTTDGQMCTDTPLCATERLLPHYCFKYGADAYEFWGVAWLTYDPYRFGWHAYIHQSDEPGRSYWVRYPNGDGFLLYPGKPIGHAGLVSSIRLEQAREGVEDYEYLYLLRRLVSEAKAAGRDVAAGEKALEQAAALVTIPNAGGRYTSKVLPDPTLLYRAREAVAQAIEKLSVKAP
jgi:hypothetical protein